MSHDIFVPVLFFIFVGAWVFRWSILAEMMQRPILHLTIASELIQGLIFLFNDLFQLIYLTLLIVFDNPCSVVRHIPLDLIDSSLAIGFYCRDKGC